MWSPTYWLGCVDLMGDPGRRLPHGFQFLAVPQFYLEAVLFGLWNGQ